MTIEHYWMGKGIDLDGLWSDFDNGTGYITKVSASPLYLLRLTFGGHPLHLPLFDFEVIFKTVKGTFHDVKAECMTPNAYDKATPIFIYRVDRGSGIFEFLAQFDPLMTWVVALGSAAMWYRKALAADQKADEDRLSFIKTHFPNASVADVKAYMTAWTTFGRRQVLYRLIGQDLNQVEVSQMPYNPEEAVNMIDMKDIVDLEKKKSDA